MDSADCWMMHDANLAPAFRLVREGYDVWLGNSRGNKYSLGHTKYDYLKDTDYWNFSLNHGVIFVYVCSFSLHFYGGSSSYLLTTLTLTTIIYVLSSVLFAHECAGLFE